LAVFYAAAPFGALRLKVLAPNAISCFSVSLLCSCALRGIATVNAIPYFADIVLNVFYAAAPFGALRPMMYFSKLTISLAVKVFYAAAPFGALRLILSHTLLILFWSFMQLRPSGHCDTWISCQVGVAIGLLCSCALRGKNGNTVTR